MAEAKWHYPKTVKQAAQLKSKHTSKALLIAGSTSVGLKKHPSIKHYIDLSQCDLAFIKKQKKKMTIGAMTRLADLHQQRFAEPAAMFLAKVAKDIASTPLRNMITVGGNIAQMYTWSELPVVLSAMNAKLLIRSAQGKRSLSCKKLCESSKQLSAGEVIDSVEIPHKGKQQAFGYYAMKKTKNDYSLMNAAAAIQLANGKIKKAAIFAGAIRPRPIKLEAVEKFLVGKKPDEISPELIAQYLKEIKPSADYRCSKEYKKQTFPVVLHRAIKDALANAAKEVKQ